MVIDTWLYGELAHFGGQADQGSYANIKVSLAEGSSIKDLLASLKMSTEKRGITFINGYLSALPDVQPDLDHILQDGDRVAFFHLLSMWPYQYRSGAAMLGELASALEARSDKGLHHSTT